MIAECSLYFKAVLSLATTCLLPPLHQISLKVAFSFDF